MTGTESAIPGGALAAKAAAPATLTATELAAELGIDANRAAVLIEVASALLEQYAPGAPIALKNESARRFGGYLSQTGFGAIAKFQAGPLMTDYQTNHANAWRNSGAAALVSRWRVRRAGAIG